MIENEDLPLLPFGVARNGGVRRGMAREHRGAIVWGAFFKARDDASPIK
jgi:hypothetical protein